MSDQQLVTGVAILISGYSQLQCSLSMFHWQIIVYLAWFSSMTHLSTLTFLRRYMHQHKRVLYLRLPLMAVFGGMLFIALLPTGSSMCHIDLQMLAVPAICCFHPITNKGIFGISQREFDRRFGAIVISQVVLLASFVSQTIKIYPWSSSFARLWLREKPGAFLKGITYSLDRRAYDSTGWTRNICLLLITLVATLLITLRTFFDLAVSALWEVRLLSLYRSHCKLLLTLWQLIWLFFCLVWGTRRLFEFRDAPVNDQSVLEEDVWSFGQWLPVLLLLISLLGTVEAYLGKNEPFFCLLFL